MKTPDGQNRNETQKKVFAAYFNRLFGTTQLSTRDLKHFPIVGRGVYGTVYRLGEHACLKLNSCPDNNYKEIQLYERYCNSSLFPRMYYSGQNYIVMEFINGTSLRTHLDNGGLLDEKWLKALVKMFEEGTRIELTLNPNARHIILTPANTIKLLDLDDIVKFASKIPFMLLNRLKKYNQKEVFLQFVKNNKKDLYDMWYNTAH